ncbi:MAG: shikimate dehydrogenase [Spirochaetaceae bacterium 4572_59]|nr:MAG: shikimate dehydrogenase [Spirochaetaceae bacterium 4572_59]
MTKLCLTLTDPSMDVNLALLEKHSPHMAELRVDFAGPSAVKEISRFPSRTDIPLILTCRKKADGGVWTGSSADRESFLLDCLEGGFDYIDLEEDEDSSALPEKAAARQCRIIRSFHDFSKLPEDLEERLLKMDPHGDLVKAAVMPRGIADVERLFRIGMSWKKDNLILLGMGDFGVPTRILASRMNSFLTFCSPSDGEGAAPGHMSIQTLRDVYRIDEINGDTTLFGIIGDPVLHSRSPHIHNKGLANTGQNGILVPYTVDDVPAFFHLAEILDIKGFCTTVPHKQAVMKQLDWMSDSVRVIGACNTVVREEDKWCGYNTDAEGFIIPLRKEKGDLRGLKAAVIGAGGAARAIVYALVQEGCQISVFNRTTSKAEVLGHEMSSGFGSLEDFISYPAGSFDLIIQTSSSGMEGKSVNGNPIESYNFTGKEFLYDIIYTPALTVIMKKAMNAGCSVLGGWSMLEEQARIQFRHFTGQELPVL